MNFDRSTVTRSLLKDSFYDFVVEFWDVIIDEDPVFNWHVKFLCDELQAIAERVFRNEPKEYDLIINIPPGTSKSTVVSQMFPAWVWLRKPSARFICASYAQPLALKDSVKSRDLVQSELYQEVSGGLELREDENMKHLFTNTKKGFRLAVGVGGLLTGFHGHFLIVDDPLNPEESYSDADMKKVNRWMRTTLPTRKVDKKVAVTILIQQRLHEGDPSGEWIYRAKGKKLKHICLPGELIPDKDGDANVKPKELENFYINGLLDPVRMTREVLDEQRKDLGEYGFASQILQRPVPLGGGTFKVDKFNLVELPTRTLVRIIRSWDKAGTKDGGNWTVGVLMGLDRHNFYWVLDVVREQFAATEREEMIERTAELDAAAGWPVTVENILEIEGGSGGKESGENTTRNTLAGYQVEAYHPTGDKESRAYPYASQVGGGSVYLLKRGWTKDYIEELRHFPNGRFTDQVDASSGAFNRLAKKKKRVGGW